MDIAPSRTRTWTPHIILFSIVLHAVVLYYVAVAFNVIPPLIDTNSEPPVIKAVTFTPPPPTPKAEPDPIKVKPFFQQRPTPPSPVPTTVPPTPFPPVASPDAGPRSIAVNDEPGEEPIARWLPPYPRMAIEQGKEGRVVLSITILPDGSVTDVQVISAQPRGYFESSALRSVKTWRYKPSNVTRTNVIVHMDFELRDS